MLHFIKSIDGALEPLRRLADQLASPVLLLAIRLYMANIFFTSGYQKFQSWQNDDWATNVFLFEEVHPVPGLSPDLAASLAMTGELVLPVMLAVGLFGRFAAAGLLAMTMVIEFGVPADYGISNPQHYLWMLLLAVPFVRGLGALSLDKLLLWSLRKGNKVENVNLSNQNAPA